MEQINRWTVILILAAMALGYGFAVLNAYLITPRLADQVSGVKQITETIDRNFAAYDKAIQDRLATVEKRLAALEKR